MKPIFLEGRDLSDTWFQLVKETMLFGRDFTVEKDGFSVRKKDLDFVSAHIEYPGSKPLIPVIPEGLNIPPPVSEDYLDSYMPYFMSDSIAPDERYTYGQDLAWQVEWVINHYIDKGHSTRHCYMTVGRPESLSNYSNLPGMECFNSSTQCLRGVDTSIKYGKLHFSIHFRSWNLWNGLPANLACLQLIKEYMASEIGVEDGSMFITCLKLNLSESVFPLAKTLIGKV